MAALLSEDGIESNRYESVEQFVIDAHACDVVLISEAMCASSERETMRELRETLPDARILVFGELDSPERAGALFGAGANGCFTLSLPETRLSEAVRRMANGEIWASRDALAAAIEWKAKPKRPDPPSLARDEIRLIRMLEAGLTNKEMAQRLGFAESTVKSRFNRLYRRFGVASRVQLLTSAMRHGILRDIAEK